jgi:hypothetical protein
VIGYAEKFSMKKCEFVGNEVNEVGASAMTIFSDDSLPILPTTTLTDVTFRSNSMLNHTVSSALVYIIVNIYMTCEF